MDSGIIYRGPSLIDGAPIVAIATYSSRNSKTGTFVQTYILREDIDPRDANKSGADYSICGSCPLRGVATSDPTRKLAKDRGCYVRIDQGPLLVWKSYKRGVYSDASDGATLRAIGARRMVRLGTYGDPAAVPRWVWDALTRDALGFTGYSHNDPDGNMRALCMQSADSLEQARAAWRKGIRTFRVVTGLEHIDNANEVLCPASAEAGKRATCATCRLCAGTTTRSPKSVAIVAHGNGAKFVGA